MLQCIKFSLRFFYVSFQGMTFFCSFFSFFFFFFFFFFRGWPFFRPFFSGGWLFSILSFFFFFFFFSGIGFFFLFFTILSFFFSSCFFSVLSFLFFFFFCFVCLSPYFSATFVFSQQRSPDSPSYYLLRIVFISCSQWQRKTHARCENR